VLNAGIVYHGGGHFINMIPTDDLGTGGSGSGYLDSSDFQTMFTEWAREVSAHSRIFFGYCSQAQGTADAIIKYLMKGLGYEVIDWAVDFDTGSTIMAEISTAKRSSRCGIFLFTRDDPMEGDSEHAAPRDNVANGCRAASFPLSIASALTHRP
jgi:Predicted nucleotide-binding protein containing TIR-like domain